MSTEDEFNKLFNKKPSKDIKCNGGHILAMFYTEYKDYSCDVCGAVGLPSDTKMHGCEACNYHVCDECAQLTLQVAISTPICQ